MAEKEVVHLEPVEAEDDLDVQIETALVGAQQDVLDELQVLHDQRKLDPESIAQRAQDPDSALHRVIFAEDDATAAWRRRVELARRLIGRVKIVTVQVMIGKVEGGGVRTTPAKIKQVRAFTSVKDETGHRSYRDTREALKDHRQQVIDELNREVRQMVNRRKSILSLDEIEKTIADVIQEIRNQQ